MGKRFGFLFSVVSVMMMVFFCACAGGGPSSSRGAGQGSNGSSQLATGSFREYAVPEEKSGLMRPAVDGKGRVWFGEMNHNALGVFDARTETFREMTPPGGKYGIMGVAVGGDGSVWFAEQIANYIGRYVPDTQQFQTYPLPTVTTPDPSDAKMTLTLPSAPNDLVLDAQGNVWFTEMNADMVGMLDVKKGMVKQYPISSQRSVQKLSPYGITIDGRGMVWFSEAGANTLGRLEPATGKVRLFTVSEIGSPLMELASDREGRIWATTFTTSRLIHFDTNGERFSSYEVGGSGTEGMYGVTVGGDGSVWVAVTGANELAQVDSKTGKIGLYHVPTAGSSPLGVAVDGHGVIWFTESIGNKIGKLQV